MINKEFKQFTIVLFILLISFININANELKKVSLQLMWLDQFEFAGFYIAKEKGLYKEAGLEVELKKFTSSTNVLNEVISGQADFGTSSTSLLISSSLGKDVLLLGTIFQSSPLILLALENSNIKTLEDFRNKTVMITDEQTSFATLQTMLSSKNIKIKDLNIIKHSFNVDDLINKKTDLMLAYLTNEPFILKEKGYESKIFNPKDYGFDFYEELIFTTNKFYDKNPELVQNFYNASMQGWKYAFANIEETAQLIFEKYNPQNKSLKSLIFEGEQMKKLALMDGIKLGNIKKEKLQLIEHSYKIMGLLNNDINYDKLLLPQTTESSLNLTLEEKAYLIQKEKITMCIDPNWMPYEKIENDKYIGMTADYIPLLEKRIGKKITLVPTNTWSQSIEYAKSRKCDIFSLAMSTPSRLKYMNFTKPYISFPLVLSTKKDKLFISNIEDVIEEKTIGIVEGYSIAELLKAKYPNHKIIDVLNVEKGLDMVERGEIYGFIGALPAISYALQHQYSNELKITGKFDYKFELGVAVRNDEPFLLDIFEKAIASIDVSTSQEILNKYISVKYEQGLDYSLFWQTLLIILILSVLGIYRYLQIIKYNKKLKKQKEIQDRTNRELNIIQAQLQSSINNFEVLLNSVMESIIVFENGICIDVNNVAIEMFGYDSKNQMVGLEIDAFAETRSLKKVKQNLNKDVTPYEVKGIKKSGEVFDILVQGKNTQMHGKKVRISTIVDISDMKNKEKLLFQQSKMAAMGEMIDNIAHQWRQPLSLVSSIATGLKLKFEFETFDKEDAIKDLDSLNQTSQHLSQTIDDFRNFFKTTKVIKEFYMVDSIKRDLDLMEGMLKNNDIQVIFERKEDVLIKSYENEFTQSLINIFYNAKDALQDIKTEKYIFINIEKDEDTALLKIRDNAGGIDPNNIEKIFDPYFTTKHKSQGTGIGLYMTHQIIEGHMRGTIEVNNSTYEYNNIQYTGAQFSIKIPLV